MDLRLGVMVLQLNAVTWFRNTLERVEACAVVVTERVVHAQHIACSAGRCCGVDECGGWVSCSLGGERERERWFTHRILLGVDVSTATVVLTGRVRNPCGGCYEWANAYESVKLTRSRIDK